MSVVDQYFSNESKLMIKSAYCGDPDMVKLKKYIVNGWPINVPSHLRQYSADVAEYCIHDGCIYRGYYLLVPQVMRNRVMKICFMKVTSALRECVVCAGCTFGGTTGGSGFAVQKNRISQSPVRLVPEEPVKVEQPMPLAPRRSTQEKRVPDRLTYH